MDISPNDVLGIVKTIVDKDDRPVLCSTLVSLGISRVLVKRLVRQGKLAEVFLTSPRGHRAAVATWEWVAKHHPQSVPRR